MTLKMCHFWKEPRNELVPEKKIQGIGKKYPATLSNKVDSDRNEPDLSEVVYDLMEASVSSMTDDNNLYMDDGVDGFPAFGFRPGSEVKQPYRLYLPEKLPAEFTLVATFKPTSFRTSYLFAVLNPFETVVQLGIRISDGPGSNQNVSLVYTNSDEHSHSEEVAKFTVPKLTKKWSKIVIKVSTSDVILYLNCHEMARQKVTRIPQELVFDTASTLYIAQAGPHIQERYDQQRYEQRRAVAMGWREKLVRCFAGGEFRDKNAPRIFAEVKRPCCSHPRKEGYPP
ncbi:PREDICTED: collagen alpha-1(XV) chain-like [Cyphomyrmex costatus]|uniref:collagen alpha-1(XV) chain-like n=1 Tax=Cyphomyrmex costatus TaxID=456900 RepID=UPI000852383A|nr:PREDICTED: collagen alpha-1(XV) chain-like [Cyphomyrmex costatus]